MFVWLILYELDMEVSVSLLTARCLWEKEENNSSKGMVTAINNFSKANNNIDLKYTHASITRLCSG